MLALKGHTDFASAHLSPDYPAGFTKRVQRKVWIETHPKQPACRDQHFDGQHRQTLVRA